MILADGTIGQMMEPVALETSEAKKVEKPWALTGTNKTRAHNIVTSLYLQPEELERTNIARFQRYAEIEAKEPRYESYLMDDAEICVVAYGIAARVSRNAVDAAREKGIRAGLIRPITLWPFPKQAMRDAAKQVKAFLSVELSMGQMIEDIELSIRCSKPVTLINRVGGMIPSPEQVLAGIEQAAGGEQK